MDKAKAAIQDFTSRSGHHDTTVHEVVAPAVQHETVKSHQHENVNTAVDKEVHQDHYHRTVQPVQDREVLPEKHTHNLGAVQHREFDNRDHESTRRNLEAEQAGFKDERIVHDTTHSQSAAPVVGGEHVHHHIHETIQPVIHKETIQPNVVHTTVPIHETHHNAAKHHEASQLPAVSMDEFKNRGGVLGGREERYDGFEGEPKHIGGALAGLKEGHHAKHDSGHQHYEGSRSGVGAGAAGGALGAGAVGAGAAHHHHNQGVAGDKAYGQRSGSSSSDEARRTTSGVSSGTTQTKKPGLLDRLNPMKDTDGDGKKGIMD